MTHKLKLWLKAATQEEIRRLAKDAGTSPGYLTQLANNHRVPSAEVAGNLENAAADIREESLESIQRLPVLYRGELAPACNRCPYFRRFCRGQNN